MLEALGESGVRTHLQHAIRGFPPTPCGSLTADSQAQSSVLLLRTPAHDLLNSLAEFPLGKCRPSSVDQSLFIRLLEPRVRSLFRVSRMSMDVFEPFGHNMPTAAYRRR
jgi:hypothetical protein